MEEPLAELTGYFQRRSGMPDAELVLLTGAAQPLAAGGRLSLLPASVFFSARFGRSEPFAVSR